MAITTPRARLSEKASVVHPRLSGSHILCECLRREGVDLIFGYPGGAVLPLYHTLMEYPIRHVLVRHEQGAAFAASGYARATGKVGVCLATSGPGATNMVTGIADAMMDSVPLVAITGQVSSPMIGKDAFQEIDTTGITLPITKHNYLVERPEDLPGIIREAFYIASHGRPGPVLIDVPKDVQQDDGDFVWPDQVRVAGFRPTTHGNVRQIRQAAELISQSKRPLIVAGHGIIISKAYAELLAFAEKAQIPVVTTLHGVSAFPESHELSFGLLGMHGAAYANKAVCECDLLIAIGMRFDDRVTGKIAGFAPKAKIVHVDIDPAEIGKNVKVTVPIVGDCKNVLTGLIREVKVDRHEEWVAAVNDWRNEMPMTSIRDTEHFLPQHVIRDIYEATGGQALIVSDVGQHQMWAAQIYWYDKPNSFFSSGGLGAMGYALPASMGVKMGRPDEIVWAVIGDGGFQVTMQELGTIVQDNIGVKIAIVNNGFLGMVRQWQQFFYDRRYAASTISAPDFVKLGDAYGIPTVRVTNREESLPAIRRAMETDGPYIVEFVVEEEENVYPMIPPGGALSDIILDQAR
ncbi:MAG TPA: biosynthetic-type acetolactate synthase large subunit [Chloroflexota bacterium]|nr:biosynthetic-type acetolactate synthase large subunit [Chloroflexota bacterium]